MLPIVGQVEVEPIAGRALLTPGEQEHPRQVGLAHPVQDLHQRRAHGVQVGPHRLPRLAATGLVRVSAIPKSALDKSTHPEYNGFNDIEINIISLNLV